MHQQSIEEQAAGNIAGTSQQPTVENLSLLFQGILTKIVRVRAGHQFLADTQGFRKNILDTLSEVEREAARLGYKKEDVNDATYAIVAFVDESVLSSSDPNRTQWSSLQADMFGKAVAGEDFFRRLDGLRRRPNSPQVADTLEVYLLCLLLGYHGRYGRIAPGELRAVAAELHSRIEQIRQSSDRFSPDALPIAVPSAAQQPDKDVLLARTRLLLFFLVIAVASLWIFGKIHLDRSTTEVVHSLESN